MGWYQRRVHGENQKDKMVSEAVDSETKPFSGHLQDVHCIDIEGDLVATGSRDCAARVFDRSTGEARFILGTPIRAGPLNKITGKCQDPPVGNKNPGQGGHSMDVNSVCLSSSRGVLYTAGDGFIKTASFAGVKPGMVFQRGPRGVGYYPDKSASNLPPVRNNAPVAQAEPEEEVTEEFITSGAKRSLIEELD